MEGVQHGVSEISAQGRCIDVALESAIVYVMLIPSLDNSKSGYTLGCFESHLMVGLTTKLPRY